MIDIGKDLQKAYDDGYKQRDSEIIRCKDCVHWYESSILEDGYCNVWQRFVPIWGFCHKGDDGLRR